MAQPAPKVTHRTPKGERSQNDLKPDFGRKDKPKKGLRNRTPLRRNKALKANTVPQELRRTVSAWRRKAKGLRYLPKRAGAMWEKKRQKPIRAQSPSPAARERRRLIRGAKRKSFEMWDGLGCIGAFLGPCSGPLEGMHGYSVGAHPELELAANPANIFPGCVHHHRTGQQSFQFYPPWTKGLQAAADLMLAADNNKCPHPSWEVLQAEIWRVITEEERGRT